MLLTFAFLFICAAGEKQRFDNYQLLQLVPTDESQVKVLRDLELAGEYDFWTRVGRVNGSVDVNVPPFKKQEFLGFLKKFNISYSCRIDNIQRLIDEEESRGKARCIDMSWNNYHRLEEINDWIDEVSKKHPTVTKVIIGKSFEGRRIKALEIAFKNTTGVFIESGIHGREWITPAATTWMINEILESPPESVFRNFSYFYIPVFNPDGYAYTWSQNRLWKKTRTAYKNRTVTCYGADPNRNWDFRWKEFGESDDPCTENYPGPSPFSETEMKSISSYLKNKAHSQNIDIYISYRSYSQRIHYPWDHQSTPAPQRKIWERISQVAVDRLRELGANYTYGSFTDFYQPSGGISREWFYGNYHPNISLTYELRDRDFGFFVPPDQIIPTGEEMLYSLEGVLTEYLKLNFTDPQLSAAYKPLN